MPNTDAEGRKAQALQDQLDTHNAQTNAAAKAIEAASLAAAMSNSRAPGNQQVTTEYSRVAPTKTSDDPTSLPNAINNSRAPGDNHPKG